MQAALDDLLAQQPAGMQPLDRAAIPVAREHGDRIARELIRPEYLTYGGHFPFDHDRVATRPGAADVAVNVHVPVEATGSRPAILWLHGGGLVMGAAGRDVFEALAWAAEHGAVVVDVDYRLAPEHPQPAAVEDAYTALHWLVHGEHDLDIDPERIIVGGISAGGGLAAGLGLLARERGGPSIRALMLQCPMLDDRQQTASSQMIDGPDIWNRHANATAWSAALGDTVGTDDVPAHVAPARATDLGGLPPAHIDVAEVEVFRDEVIAFAQDIWAAGGSAELHVYPGAFHAFHRLAPNTVLAEESNRTRAAWVRRVLA